MVRGRNAQRTTSQPPSAQALAPSRSQQSEWQGSVTVLAPRSLIGQGILAFRRLFLPGPGIASLEAVTGPGRALPSAVLSCLVISKLVRNAESHRHPIRAEPRSAAGLGWGGVGESSRWVGSQDLGLWVSCVSSPHVQISASPGQRSSTCRPSPEQVSILPLPGEVRLGVWAGKETGQPGLGGHRGPHPGRSRDNGSLVQACPLLWSKQTSAWGLRGLA